MLKHFGLAVPAPPVLVAMCSPTAFGIRKKTSFRGDRLADLSHGAT